MFKPKRLLQLHTVCRGQPPVAPTQQAALWQCGRGALVPPPLIALRERGGFVSRDDKRFSGE